MDGPRVTAARASNKRLIEKQKAKQLKGAYVAGYLFQRNLSSRI